MRKTIKKLTKDFIFIIITERTEFPEMEEMLYPKEIQAISILIFNLAPKKIEDKYLTDEERQILKEVLMDEWTVKHLVEWLMLVQSRVKRPEKASTCFTYTKEDWATWLDNIKQYIP